MFSLNRRHLFALLNSLAFPSVLEDLDGVLLSFFEFFPSVVRHRNIQSETDLFGTFRDGNEQNKNFTLSHRLKSLCPDLPPCGNFI